MLGESAARLSWRCAAFELDPNVPPEGVDARAYMAGNYPPDMVEAMHGRLMRIAREEGLAFRDFSEQTVRPNTFDGHRLLAAALRDGVARQQALAGELFAAHWVRGENVGLPDVLVTAATTAGMPRERAEGVLGGKTSRRRCGPRNASPSIWASVPCRPSSSTSGSGYRARSHLRCSPTPFARP